MRGFEIADAVRHVPGGDHIDSASKMSLLVIKEQVGAERLKKAGLVQAAEEQGFVQPDVPFAQGTNHPLMGRRTLTCAGSAEGLRGRKIHTYTRTSRRQFW